MKINIRESFFEKQSFWDNKILRVIVIVTLVISLLCYYFFIMAYKEDIMGRWQFSLLIIFILYIDILLLSMRLVTTINSEGISSYFYFFPFKIKRVFLWSDIKQFEIMQFSPIKDFAGWGIRFNSILGRGFVIGGSRGMRIITNDNKRYFIGTLYPEEITQKYIQ
jgi:hypothetical protein